MSSLDDKIIGVTVAELRNRFDKGLANDYPYEEIRQYFNMLCAAYYGFSAAEVVLHLQQTLTVVQEQMMLDALVALQQHKPIQYVLGEVTFENVTLCVDETVLIPRPETAELVQWVLSEHDNHEKLRVLDIGTGSGCVAIALKKARPNWDVTAWDVDSDALKTAIQNAQRNAVCVAFEEVDVLASNLKKGAWDIIVSNPPYVPESFKEQTKPHVLCEPQHAIFVPETNPLLFYDRIVSYATTQLQAEGSVYFEGHAPLMKALELLLKKTGFYDIVLRNDFRNNPRLIRAYYS